MGRFVLFHWVCIPSVFRPSHHVTQESNREDVCCPRVDPTFSTLGAGFDSVDLKFGVYITKILPMGDIAVPGIEHPG